MRAPPAAPAIPPPGAGGAPRPLWTVIIPVHNCARFLRRTLESVLDQDPGPEEMQICVIDDASSDAPVDVIAGMMARHRIEFHRHTRNMGHTRTFNHGLSLARGRFIHLLHGDDLVRPDFYVTMARHLEGTAGAAFCRQVMIDESDHWHTLSALVRPDSGLLSDAATALAANPVFCSAAVVVRRSVYEEVGGFDESITCCGEDQQMWLRIAAACPVAFEAEPLALYRLHRWSLTSAAQATGANVRDLRAALDGLRGLLPEAVRARARLSAALWATASSLQLGRMGARRAAIAQSLEAVRTSAAPIVLLRATRSVLTALFTRRAGLPQIPEEH